MRRITILGATGSIGQSTIDLIARNPDAYVIEALTGGHSVETLARDAIRLNAKCAVTAHADRLQDLRAALSGTGIAAAAGPAALIEAADRPADWVMSAIVGAAGLAPGLAALKRGATLALANKESLVCAGPLVMAEAARSGARLLPVDSEHSAVFQALLGEKMESVERVILTASGGAFRDWPLADLARATPEQAATHPNWSMGQRITVDSASMFNKALEVIEAHEYFGISPDRIEVLVHPESLVHALVGHVDGAILAHLGAPDMRHAIGYALHWPDRCDLPVARLDLAEIATLNFRRPEMARYPALEIAQRVMQRGGLSGAVMNAAKEVALDAFLDRRIGFTDMVPLVSRVLDRLDRDSGALDAEWCLEHVLAADQMARSYASEALGAAAGAEQKAGIS
ncbi:1-deoxy-D-xylulose-5-phosphate reductoisomerase [Pseudooceanicola algae]|uniref:1-deoxy-D-xylulose 5-phosphate reductoisomerase n=1 Tax=Pseudooceanicola algae TaxID=1537215 RepID=A0A418SDS9_9RHOB|nr:1-deoxy-D-xylulose-5-phosphate reductoisomerase [Pseudooceanicola algae]QPM89504.1 1-deoxy-D-xylulose 5-phosphate reductoisomerase [Pseudooceanicola algae]